MEPTEIAESKEIETVTHGELTPVYVPTYPSISEAFLKPEEVIELMKPIETEDLDILPTGEVFASQIRYRRVLNKIFTPGGWALMPRSEFRLKEGTLTREYALFVRGHFISEAIGEQDYFPNNPRMSYATAAEGVKSNALTRCCKDLGIASECWDRRFCEKFKKDHCLKVWCRNKKTGEVFVQWRLKDSDPFFNETGLVKEGEKQTGAPPEEQTKPQPIPSDEISKMLWMGFAADVKAVLGDQKFYEVLGKLGFEKPEQAQFDNQWNGIALQWMMEMSSPKKKEVITKHNTLLRKIRIIGQ